MSSLKQRYLFLSEVTPVPAEQWLVGAFTLGICGRSTNESNRREKLPKMMNEIRKNHLLELQWGVITRLFFYQPRGGVRSALGTQAGTTPRESDFGLRPSTFL
eukprot:EG_transcript_20678